MSTSMYLLIIMCEFYFVIAIELEPYTEVSQKGLFSS